MHFFYIFFQKNLVISKKSNIFATDLKKDLFESVLHTHD